jgi:hypothetical protein
MMAGRIEQIRAEIQEMQNRINDADSNDSVDRDAEDRRAELELDLQYELQKQANQNSTQPAQTGTTQPAQAGTTQAAQPPTGPRYPNLSSMFPSYPKSFANEDAKKLYDWAINREMNRDAKTPEEAAYIQEVKKTLGMPTFSYKPDLTKFTQAVLPSGGTEPVRRPGVTAPEFTLDQLKEGQPGDSTEFDTLFDHLYRPDFDTLYRPDPEQPAQPPAYVTDYGKEFSDFQGPKTEGQKKKLSMGDSYFPARGDMFFTPEFEEYLKSKGYQVDMRPTTMDLPPKIYPPGVALPKNPLGIGDTVIGQELGAGTAETSTSAAPSPPYYTPSGDELVETQYTDFLYPSLAPGTAVDFDEIEVQPDELIATPDILEEIDTRYTTASSVGLDVTVPTKPDPVTYSASLIEGTPEYEAAKGTVSANSLVGDIQGTVSAEAIAQAQTEELDERATVQYQMEKLFESFEDGKPPPPWAAPAMRAAGAVMAQRGLGRSSMAAAAITQAALESGIQISVQDANKYAAIQITNLNNKQQATLQNAMTYAAMDRANLDARMTAAVNNAKAFLAIDLENLKNEQQLKTIDLQNQYQVLFTNQAAENAARQFNAKSQMQVDQFFAELDVQVQNANANRLAAMRQFNTDQINASFRYYDKINDERERFNVNMQVQIDQSNAVWRREVNTRNTAVQNEENRINAANLLAISQNALNRLWQKYRDEAKWTMQQSENAIQRAHQIAMFAQENEWKKESYEQQFEDSVSISLGQVGLTILSKLDF